MANIKKIQIGEATHNISINQAISGQGYGSCETAAATAAKAVTISNYELNTGGIVVIKFKYAVPANATLNISSKGAKNIFYKGSKIIAGIINAGEVATFIYDGTQYHLIGLDRDRLQTTLAPLGTQITASSSSIVALNSTQYLKVGNYFCSANAQAEFISDLPKAKTAFMMQVYSPLSTTIDNEGGTWIYRIRKLLFYTGEEYVQYCYSDGTAGHWNYGAWWRAATSGSDTGAASGNTANSTAFDTGAATGNTANSTAFNTGAATGDTESTALTTKGASGNTANSTAFDSGAATGNTANSTAFDTGAATGSTESTDLTTNATADDSTNRTSFTYCNAVYSNEIITFTNATVSLPTAGHVHTINSHGHGLNSHKHSVGAHNHGLNSHTHSVGAHAHGLNSHTHDIDGHAHGLNSHKHSVGAHAHGLNSHKHSVGAHAHGLNSHKHTQQ